MGIRHDNEREVAQRLDAMGEAGGQDGKGEVGRLEELLGCQWWSSMSVACAVSVTWANLCCATAPKSVSYFTRSARVMG